MKKVIFVLTILCLSMSAAGVEYKDFPPGLQKILVERTAELKEKGGIYIAGRVTLSDGAVIINGDDVKINFLQRADLPLWVYEGGWFVMDRVFKGDTSDWPAKLILRAYGYDTINSNISVVQGEITYLEFEMQKTADEGLSSVSGIVLNDRNESFDGAFVSIRQPNASQVLYSEPLDIITTKADGKFFFEWLSPDNYYLVASAPGYANQSVMVKLVAGKTTEQDLKLYPNMGIIIDYVYQADGSRSFTGGQLQAGTLEWVNGNYEGADFSQDRTEAYDPNSPRDIEMRQDKDELKFYIVYVQDRNGFYDAGEMEFESVTEAAETGYLTDAKPCIVGHTYVVRTYEGNYAKFVVSRIYGKE